MAASPEDTVMDFWTYPTLYTTLRDKVSPELRDLATFHANAMAGMVAQGDPIGPKQVDAEHHWLQDSRPYYHLYPGILEPLLNLALDLDTGAIRPPRRALSVCLPTDHQHPRLTFEHGKVQSILMAKGVSQQNQVSHDAINLFIDVGERMAGCPIHTFRSFRTTEGCTLQGELDGLPDHESAKFGLQIPRPLIIDCVRLCATLCLLADDPEIIEADVLNKDRQKYLASRDEKYIEKAHRRGKVGWLVGRDLEMSPHYRRGHFALFWTGAGRHVPKVGWRKGTVVHREQVVKVPTGEMG
jgi:hypothetical protein